MIFSWGGLRELLIWGFLLDILRLWRTPCWIRRRCRSAVTRRWLLCRLFETFVLEVSELFEELAQIVLGFSYDIVTLELLKALSTIDDMGAREECLGAFSFRVAVLHREPVCHVDIAPMQAFFQPWLACQVSFTSVLIDEAAFFQILMIGVLSAQNEF